MRQHTTKSQKLGLRETLAEPVEANVSRKSPKTVFFVSL
jgi:hypothetical protein